MGRCMKKFENYCLKGTHAPFKNPWSMQ